ncbi:MAG: glutamate--tRNA ligase [Pseudomonadota bacterium]|nr:glutamate--tRNA ligase [Pseudomonadota bacterium]
MSVTTRFAPSPTGYLHIGGARTALYSWLYARQQGGRFVLRIEDTDRERSTEESVQAILDGMAWLGLEADEAPVFQTARFDRYKALTQQLLDSGHAYHCYCSKDELETMREEARAAGRKPMYDGRCRDRKEPVPGVEPVVRFRSPDDGETAFDDLIKGRVVFQNKELDDLIIARGDGTPTYNFTVVVDDYEMGISHVIRGDDHVNNTPRQIQILEALGATVPVYAHVPMILGEDGKRLSKRHGAVGVMSYRDEGYLPEALLNYLVRLGWSHGDQEVFTRDEMLAHFRIEQVQKGAGAFNPSKLVWINHQHLQSMDPAQVLKHWQWHLDQAGIDVSQGPDPIAVIESQRERCKTLVEMTDKSRFFYEAPTEYADKAVKKWFKGDAQAVLTDLLEGFKALPEWTGAAAHAVVHGVAERRELGLGKVAQPIRVAVSGDAVSPPIDETLELLGREQTETRIARAIEFLAARDAA